MENLRHLSADPIQTDCKSIMYLVRPQVNFMKMISSHIQHDTKQNLQREYSVIFVPRRTIVCEKVGHFIFPFVLMERCYYKN